MFLNQWEKHHLSLNLLFQLPVKESDTDSLISYVNEALVTASDGMKELYGFSYGIKAPEGLQPNRFESVLNPLQGIMSMYCDILLEKDLVCFDEGHQPNS